MCEVDLNDFQKCMGSATPHLQEECTVQMAVSLSELQDVVNSLDASGEQSDNIKLMMKELKAQMSKSVDSTPSPQWRKHNDAEIRQRGPDGQRRRRRYNHR